MIHLQQQGWTRTLWLFFSFSCDDTVWLEFIVTSFVGTYILLHLVYHLQFNRLPSVCGLIIRICPFMVLESSVRMLGSSQPRTPRTTLEGFDLVYLEASKRFLRMIESIICNAHHLLLLLYQHKNASCYKYADSLA